MKITILGTGASAGVPHVGCSCAVCVSSDPRNKRRRVSIHIQQGDSAVLIDTSPDLRQQALDNHISKVDAVLYTHAHADHTHGIDDVRSYNYINQAPLPAYASAECFATLKHNFAYAFLPNTKEYGWFRPSLVPHEVQPLVPFTAGSMTFLPFQQIHGKITSLGFRCGDFAYSTDVNFLPEESFAALAGVKCWVVDCLCRKPAPSHAHLDMTLEWIRRVKPERAILTHMNHEFDYEALARELPEGVEPGYDGMVVAV